MSTYRKMHLFDAITDDNAYRESKHTLPGDEIVLVRNTPVGTLGVSTCYDVRFPSLYAVLRDRGATTLLVPSAFTTSTGSAHWEVLLRARAIETQCYVVAAAQVGLHGVKRCSYGQYEGGSSGAHKSAHARERESFGGGEDRNKPGEEEDELMNGITHSPE